MVLKQELDVNKKLNVDLVLVSVMLATLEFGILKYYFFVGLMQKLLFTLVHCLLKRTCTLAHLCRF